MKNRVLGLALAMTMIPATLFNATVGLARGIGKDLRLNRYDWGAQGPCISKRSGRTVSMDKRDAAKRRNVLRAKGRHRDAVR